MFKRANKITALVVAAASVMSVVPAMAVDKLGTKDGTIYEAVAYDNGQYAYYGYRTDDDDTGIWYNSGSGSDKEIDDLEDYEMGEDGTDAKYGEKYAYVTESGNNDEYLVDLSSGDIADEDTPEDQEASAKAKLISALKKAERFNETSDSDYEIDSDSVNTTRLFQNQFGDLWYQFITTGTSATATVSMVESSDYDDYEGATVTDTNTTTSEQVSFGNTVFTGFTNTSGKYIDASYLANMKIYNPRKDKATVIEQYNKIYKDEALKVNLKGLKALAQDSDYIYALATVQVLYYGQASGSYVYSDDAETTVSTTQYFIQKIAKSRDTDTEDGAYIPASVESWQLDNETMYDYDDGTDAYEAITGTDSDILSGTTPRYSVKDGVLYVTYLNTDSEVDTCKLTLGKDKIDIADTTLTAMSEETNPGTDIDTKIVTVDEEDTQGYDDDIDQTWGAVSFDAEGNVWVIDDGEIMEFDGADFTTQYKCDQSLDRLDVYNSGSLIAWEEDGDTYTTVQEGKDQTVTDATEINPDLGKTTAATVGWKQEATGWTFYDVNGQQVTSKWVIDNGTWYYIKADGIMATGWVQDGSAWYYLNAAGAMQTGWIQDGNAWYYLSGSGAMLSNTTVDGYQLGANGAWVK